MSRGNWNRIKHTKFFYVNTYRQSITLILVSQILNVLFCLAIIYSYFHKPARTFYATNGVTPPIQLTPLDTPNYSAEALLQPDPVDNENTKVVPE